MDTKIDQIFLTEKQAAERYQYTRAWFQKRRYKGDGPKFLKVVGKILYPLKKTDDWFFSHKLRDSTNKGKRP